MNEDASRDKLKSVEIINNGDGTCSLRVFETVVLTGTRFECEQRAGQEAM